MFERILVAVDGSEHSKKALTMGCDIARKYQSDLYLVHTPQVETTAVALGAGVVAVQPEMISVVEAGEKVLEDARAAVAELGLEAKDSMMGDLDPADDILRYAELQEADLIIMGRRGLGGIASLLLGSVSQKVIHGAKCTCMTVFQD